MEQKPSEFERLAKLSIRPPFTVLKIAVRFGFGMSLIVLSIRAFLFGNGLFVYRDWSWPLSTQRTPTAAFAPSGISNGVPDPFGFTRMFLTWPVYVIDKLTSDPIIAEKWFIIYLWGVFVFLSFLLAELLSRLLNRYSSEPLTTWKKETLVLFVVSFSFANFWSLEQLSGMYYTYFIEFMLVGISTVMILLMNSGLKAVVLAGVALSFCILLDPNIYLFGLIANGITVMISSLKRASLLASAKKTVVRLSLLISTSLPALLTVVYALEQATGTNLRAPGTYLSSSVNLSFDNAIRLLGYSWSLIVYAPPTILVTKSAMVSAAVLGTPPLVLLPSGLMADLWLAATWFVPFFAFAIIYFKPYRRVSVVYLATALVGLLLTQPSIIPLPYQLEGPLGAIPLVGGAYSTVFAIPDHILIIVALGYLMLVAIGVHFLLSKFPRRIELYKNDTRKERQNKRSYRTKLLAGLILGLVMFMLLFPSWQFFSGSFFPSSFTPGEPGNGIPQTGAFSASQPPQNMLDTYNWLFELPGDFNVYWPGPDGATYPWNVTSTPSIAGIDSPKPTYLTSSAIPGMFPAGLQYLLASNLTGSVAEYLAALNIKYLIAQPYSPAGLAYSWGIGDYAALTRTLQGSSGIYLARSEGDISVYAVNDTWRSIYSPDIVLNYEATDPGFSVAYSALSALGTHLALTSSGGAIGKLCIDKVGCTVSIFSPQYLSSISSNESLQVLSGTGYNRSSYALTQSTTVNLPAPLAPWTLANWGPSEVNATIDESMRWTFAGNSVISLSYNGTVTDHKPGGISIPNGYQAIVDIAFSYRTSGTNPSLRLVIPLLNDQLATTSTPVSPDFIGSQDWRFANYKLLLPRDTAMFTVRLQGTGSNGWIDLQDVSMKVAQIRVDNGAPFGALLPINGVIPKNLGIYSGYSYLQVRGNGYVSYGNR